MIRRGMLTIFAVLAVVVSTVCGGDWAQFRGPSGSGISQETNVPLSWGPEKNIKWRVELPALGNSSPIVSGDRVFVTVASPKGKERSLYCFHREDGRQLWVRTVHFEGSDRTHKTSCFSPATAAADGQRVVVWYASAGLHCYDYEGNKLWSRDLGKFGHIWGYGASPIFYRDKVVLNCGPGERTFVTAIDKHTGRTLWQTDEPGGVDGQVPDAAAGAQWVGSWSTPMIANVDGKDQIIVSLPYHVQAYDPEDGTILWKCGGLGTLVYTMPLITDTVAVVMGGFYGPAIGLRLGGKGDTTEKNLLWRNPPRNPQRIASGVIVGKHVFQANGDTGTIECIELATGRQRWKERMPKSQVSWGSVVAAAGRLYVTNRGGHTIVFAPNPDRLEVLAVNSLNEPSDSTLAISEGQIFLRTFKALYCIEEKPPAL